MKKSCGWQRDDAVYQVGLDDFAANLAVAPGVARQAAIRHDEPSDAAASSVRIGEVVDEMLDPGVVGVTDGRVAVSPPLVPAQELARPIADVERRVSEDEIGLEVGMEVSEERVSWLFTEFGLNAVDG